MHNEPFEIWQKGWRLAPALHFSPSFRFDLLPAIIVRRQSNLWPRLADFCAWSQWDDGVFTYSRSAWLDFVFFFFAFGTSMLKMCSLALRLIHWSTLMHRRSIVGTSGCLIYVHFVALHLRFISGWRRLPDSWSLVWCFHRVHIVYGAMLLAN